jgi:hypothetical protein
MSPTSPDAAELRIRQIWDESAGLYAEGANSYVRVERLNGDKLIERQLDLVGRTTVRLDPGSYRLVGWQRPCDGDCGSLDSPTDECSGELRVRPSRPVQATVTVRAGEGCSIKVK